MWLDYSKGHSKFCIDAGAGKYEVFKDPFSTKTVWVLNYSAIKTFFCSTQQINHRAGFDVRYPLLFTPGPSSPPLLGPRASGTLTRNKSSLLVSSSIILGGTFQRTCLPYKKKVALFPTLSWPENRMDPHTKTPCEKVRFKTLPMVQLTDETTKPIKPCTFT